MNPLKSLSPPVYLGMERVAQREREIIAASCAPCSGVVRHYIAGTGVISTGKTGERFDIGKIVLVCLSGGLRICYH